MDTEMIEYTKLSKALIELESRKSIQPKVEAYLAERGLGLPWGTRTILDKPLAILSRHVASPNYETLRFLSIGEGFDLDHMVLEYHQDFLSMSNPLKKTLVHMPVVEKISGRGFINYKKHWITDPEIAKKRVTLESIVTLTGESLPNFHKRLFSLVGRELFSSDISKWFKSAGGTSATYYQSFLAAFVCHGILFENFTEKEAGESAFTSEVVAPAFDEVKRQFGLAPLVVPLEPTEVEDHSFWSSYPREILDAFVWECRAKILGQ